MLVLIHNDNIQRAVKTPSIYIWFWMSKCVHVSFNQMIKKPYKVTNYSLSLIYISHKTPKNYTNGITASEKSAELVYQVTVTIHFVRIKDLRTLYVVPIVPTQ